MRSSASSAPTVLEPWHQWSLSGGLRIAAPLFKTAAFGGAAEGPGRRPSTSAETGRPWRLPTGSQPHERQSRRAHQSGVDEVRRRGHERPAPADSVRRMHIVQHYHIIILLRLHVAFVRFAFFIVLRLPMLAGGVRELAVQLLRPVVHGDDSFVALVDDFHLLCGQLQP